MNCREIRDQVMQADQRALSRDATAHLEACASCSEFSRRMDIARAAFRAHETDHLPDAGFARRVQAALPGGTELVGWAALRLLPATLALTLVLTAWCWLATPGPQALLEQSPTDDLLAWALEENGS